MRVLQVSDGFGRIPPPADLPPESLQAEEEERELERHRSEHQRDQRFRRLIGWGVSALIVIVFIIIAAALIALGYHLLMPERLHWLDGDGIENVKDFALSGALVGFGTAYVRRYFSPS